MNLKNRILQFIEYKGITVQEFEKRAGLSNASVSKMGDNTRTSTLDKLSNSFPELNVNWLRTGEGEMLIANSQASMPQDTDARKGMIPFYDAETTGGHNGRVSSSNSTSEMIGYIHAGGWFAGRETAAIRHVGESMTEYPNGCILAVREVLDRNLLVPGKNYVIETSEYRVTKRIQHGSSKDTISLYSTNQEKYEDGRLVYEPFEVSLADVRRIFSVLGYIVNQSGEFTLVKV